MSSQKQAKQSTWHLIFRRTPAVECQKDAKWLKGMLNNQESVEWSGGRQTTIKALVTKMARRADKRVSGGYQVFSRTSSDRWCQESV